MASGTFSRCHSLLADSSMYRGNDKRARRRSYSQDDSAQLAIQRNPLVFVLSWRMAAFIRGNEWTNRT